MSGGGGGYDISASASTSESATQGAQMSKGDFIVGGSKQQIPVWVWVVGLVIAGWFVWKKKVSGKK